MLKKSIIILLSLIVFIYFLKAPLFKTAGSIDEAMKVANIEYNEILFQKDIDGKTIVFYTCNDFLNVGLLSKNILGWKWVTGAGSAELVSNNGMSWVYSTLGSDNKEKLYLFFGAVIDPDIKYIKIKVNDSSEYKYANIVETARGSIWYLVLDKPQFPGRNFIALSDNVTILYEYP